MPRPRSPSRQDLVENAMWQFWKHGYDATSVDALVHSTGVGRGALYTEFGGKRALFLACLDHYQHVAVTPGFDQVEADGATLASIQSFFNDRMAAMKSKPMPSYGCLVCNTATELAAHDPEIAQAVRAHFDRMTKGFANALANEMDLPKTNKSVRQLAAFLTMSLQGLWTVARCTTSAREVEDHVDTLMDVLKTKLDA